MFSVGRVIVVFLLFVYVFFGLCYCGFSTIRLCLLWAARLWFFCSSFVSSVGHATAVFLFFVYVFFGLCDCGFSALCLCLLWGARLRFLYSSFVSSLGCDCMWFSTLPLCLLWAVRLWFFYVSLVGRVIVVFLLFVYVFCGPCDCGFSALRLCLLCLGCATAVFLLFVCVFFRSSTRRSCD